MSMSGDPFASARRKARWAGDKAGEVHRRVDDYLDSDPIEVTPETRGRRVDVVAHVQTPIPEELALVVGEWAHSLRSALDHVVYAHVDDPAARKNCAFPVWRKEQSPTPEQWAKSVLNAIPGLRATGLRSIIEDLQPYKNGREEFLWTLTELDNIDKHRVTLDVVASIRTTKQVTQAHLVSEREAAALNPNEGMLWQISTDQPLSHPLIRNPTMADFIADARLEVEYMLPDPEPVQDGDVVYTFARHEWRDVLDIKPVFRVVLGQEPFTGQPLLELIDSTTLAVQGVLDRLAQASRR